MRRLRVTNFGVLGTQEFSFAPGINVVRGPNEAGKTTLAEALAKVLFAERDVDTSDRDYLRWRTWGRGENFRLEAEVEHAGERWQVIRDFAGRECRLKVARPDGAGEEVVGDDRVRSRIAAAVGFSQLKKGARGGGPTAERQYLATAYLRQGEWTGVQEASGLRDLVERAASHSAIQVNAQRVADQLKRMLKEIERGTKGAPAKEPGRLAKAQAELEEVKDKLAEARLRLQEQQRTAAELEQIEIRLEEISRELEGLPERLEKAEERRELEEELERLEQRAEELSSRLTQVDELQRTIEAAAEELRSLREIDLEKVEELERLLEQTRILEAEAAEARKAAEEAKQRAEAIKREIEELRQSAPTEEDIRRSEELHRQAQEAAQARQEAEQRAERLRRAGSRRRVLGGLLALAGLGAFALAAFLPLPSALKWALAAIGVGLIGVGGRLAFLIGWGSELQALLASIQEAQRREQEAQAEAAEILSRYGAESHSDLVRRYSEAAKRLGELRQELGRHTEASEREQKRAEQAAARSENIQRQISDQLAAWSVAHLSEAREVALKRRAAQERAEKARAQLRAVAQARADEEVAQKVADMRDEHQRLVAEIKICREKLDQPELRAAKMSDQEYVELNERVRRLQEEMQDLENRRALYKDRLEREEDFGQKVAELEERKKALEGEIKRLERRRAVYRAALEMLEQAMAEAAEAAQERIAPVASEYLRVLTGGRWAELRLDEQLRPQVDAPPGAEAEVEVDRDLSFATREQVYLALRLAMMRAIWPEDGPPVIMDEPLLAFDAQRKRAALKLLRDFARGRQVIILTCSQDYDEIADQIIELEPQA